MIIALTGGTGFVGSALCNLLLEAGHTVQALTRRLTGADLANGKPQPQWVEGTLADPAALTRLCKGADAVIHVAGAVNLPTRDAFAKVNIAGTQALVAAASAAGVSRFVHVSSLAAREPGLSDYGWSKAGAEDAVRASGLDWVMVRPPAIYGPRDTEMLDMFRAVRWGVLPMPPAGRASVIHVDDLARALLAVTQAASVKVGGRLFDPDDGRAGGWPHRELALAIGRAMGKAVWAPHLPAMALFAAARFDRLLRGQKAKLTPDRARYMVHPDWVSDPAHGLPEDLWVPRIATEEGLAATAQWYRQHRWL